MKKKLGDMTIRELGDICDFFRGTDCAKCPFWNKKAGKCWAYVVCPSSWDFEMQMNVVPLTPPEMEICRVLGAKWLSMDANGFLTIELWNAKPEGLESDDKGFVWIGEKGTDIGSINHTLLPSVKPGDLIYVGEGEENE